MERTFGEQLDGYIKAAGFERPIDFVRHMKGQGVSFSSQRLWQLVNNESGPSWDLLRNLIEALDLTAVQAAGLCAAAGFPLPAPLLPIHLCSTSRADVSPDDTEAKDWMLSRGARSENSRSVEAV